jgi:hypothetical protein
MLRIVHNWGNGAEESSLYTFSPHRAIGALPLALSLKEVGSRK